MTTSAELLIKARDAASRASLNDERDAAPALQAPWSGESTIVCANCGSEQPPNEANDCPDCGQNRDRAPLGNVKGASFDDGSAVGGGSVVSTGGSTGDMTGSVSSSEPTTKRYKSRRKSADHPELRISSENDGITNLTGWPSLTSTNYDVYDSQGRFTERMAPACWDRAVRDADCRFLFDHDGLPLARTLAGTLTVTSLPRGLHCTARLDTQGNVQARDLVNEIRRGSVSQMSCGFRVAEDEWNSDFTVRVIHRIDKLLDVSPVTYPASPTTSITVAEPDALRDLRRRHARSDQLRRRFRETERRRVAFQLMETR